MLSTTTPTHAVLCCFGLANLVRHIHRAGRHGGGKQVKEQLATDENMAVIGHQHGTVLATTEVRRQKRRTRTQTKR